MFASSTWHKRAVDTLAKALPIEAADPRKQRQTIKAAAAGLQAKGYPYLKDFDITHAANRGDWVAEFSAVRKVPQDYPLPKASLRNLSPSVQALIDDIVTAVDDHGSEFFWAQAIGSLGPDLVRYALSEITADMREGRVTEGSRPAALLNVRLQKLASERGVSITHHQAIRQN